jgi:hypothetical protein
MKYIQNTAHRKMMEAQGWQLLHDTFQKANFTEEQWLCINLALGFPVMDEAQAKSE